MLHFVSWSLSRVSRLSRGREGENGIGSIPSGKESEVFFTWQSFNSSAFGEENVFRILFYKYYFSSVSFICCQDLKLSLDACTDLEIPKILPYSFSTSLANSYK